METILLGGYIATIMLKLARVPWVRDIQWKYIILAPVVYFLLKWLFGLSKTLFLFGFFIAAVFFLANFMN